MEFIGDLERAFASAIYPSRILIAIVGVIVIIGLAMLAWRGRWDMAARRHPRATVVGMVVALAIIGPLGWYVGSPLVVSSTIDEPPPIVAARGTLGPVEQSPSATATPSAETDPASPATTPFPPAELAERSGSFTGADEFHFGNGTARLIETAPGRFTVRLENFAVRNGPDLFVYLSPSPDGYSDGAVELGPLKADRGNQNYEVPARTDVASVRSVVIWCKQFAVLFATAPLQS